MHTDPHPLAGHTATAAVRQPDGETRATAYLVEDWWDRVAGKSLRDSVASGNLAALEYVRRVSAVRPRLPVDDEVVYGKTPGGHGHLVHATELSNP